MGAAVVWALIGYGMCAVQHRGKIATTVVTAVAGAIGAPITSAAQSAGHGIGTVANAAALIFGLEMLLIIGVSLWLLDLLWWAPRRRAAATQAELTDPDRPDEDDDYDPGGWDYEPGLLWSLLRSLPGYVIPPHRPWREIGAHVWRGLVIWVRQ